MVRDLKAFREESDTLEKEFGLERELPGCKCPRCNSAVVSGFIRNDHEGRLEPPEIREVYRCYDCGWRSEIQGPPPGQDYATVVHQLGKVKIAARDKVSEKAQIFRPKK